MRRLSETITLGLLLGTALWGQPSGPNEATCPVDNYHFKIPRGEFGDGGGGMDSDQCVHHLRGQMLPYMVVVCPQCSFAAHQGDFITTLSPEHKRQIWRELAASRYRGVTDSVLEIPGWERFRLAAKCAAILGREKEQIDYVKWAAWSARIEACRPATVAYSNPVTVLGPLSVQLNRYQTSRAFTDVVREIDEKIASTKEPGEKSRLRLHLVMIDQRAGFAKERDTVLAQLKASAAGDEVLMKRVEHFEKLVALETEFQKQFVDLMKKRLEKEKDASRAERTVLTYVLADTLRRLGDRVGAIEQFRGARKLMTEPNSITRVYTDHFLSMLAPGEPLPVPEPEKQPAFTETESPVVPAPTTPLVEPETPTE